MNARRLLFSLMTATLFFAVPLAHGASVSGTVTDKTTGKPAAGDTVVLVDVQAGMSEVAHVTTDAQGRYTLNQPGPGPYLIRVVHQGAPYFIAAPQGNGPGDIPVYDVAAKVDGVSVEADVLEFETDNGQLRVTERYFVHNTSSPPRTEWSPRSFEIALPPDATIAGTAAQRPTGLPTSVNLEPTGAKGHYAFNFPIQPDEGEKDTLFQVEYTVPYNGSFIFHPRASLATQSVGVLLPKSMTFAAGSGSTFQPIQQDPNIQTYVARNLEPGKELEFTISGTGSMPREAQGGAQGGEAAGQATGAAPTGPGGGIGEPINTPDPLSKYKWWILGALALLLAAAAAFLLRKPAGPVVAVAGGPPHAVHPALQPTPMPASYAPAAASSAPANLPSRPASPKAWEGNSNNSTLLAALKEELFALESEKISGTITSDEYAEVKPALEVVLRRALKRNG